MDTFFTYEDQCFVWSIEKAEENVRKHGIRFEQACEAVVDPIAVFLDASIPSESRQAAVGLSWSWKLLYVVLVVREGDLIRIISAREATKHEQRTYEDND